MVGSGNTTDLVRTYNVTTPFDLTTASHANINFPTSPETTPTSIFMSPDGLRLFVLGLADVVRGYLLETPWDISTANTTAYTSANIAGGITNSEGLAFNPEGTKLFVADRTTGIYSFTLSNPWDLSTLSFVTNTSIGEDSAIKDVFINSTGTRMIVAGDTNNRLYTYTLSTPWDATTKSLSSTSSVLTDTSVTSVQFDSTGTKMLVVGSSSDTVYSYTLSTAWAVSTAGSATSTLSVSGQDSVPQGLFIIPNIQGSTAKGYRATANSGTEVTWTAAEIVVSEIIAANAITANQLQISANEPGASRMFFNGGSNRIEIYDSSGTLRVALGNLTDL